MNRFFPFIFSLLLLACGGLKAQSNTDKSLLWRISGKQMDKPSYLFGTIHMICKNDYVWTDKMKESFDKSEEVCLELDISNPSVLMQIAEGFIDSSGKRLADYFTPAQYKKLQAYMMDSLGIDLSIFQQMKPIVLESVFTEKATNCDSPVSYEENLATVAKSDHKIVAGLEDPREQIAVLETIPTDSVIKDILKSISGVQNDDNGAYNKLLAAYKRQDLPALYEMIQSSKDLEDDMGAFLDERNKKWIARMVDKMEQKSVFFAVGAGHLWGTNGVINLLRKAGYTVVPVK